MSPVGQESPPPLEVTDGDHWHQHGIGAVHSLLRTEMETPVRLSQNAGVVARGSGDCFPSGRSREAFALTGNVVTRHMRCGKISCRCKADPPVLHGPYIPWTHKVAGKTVTRFLNPDQLERYQPWFDHARRLRELSAELEALSPRVAERAEAWLPKAEPRENKPPEQPPRYFATACSTM